MWYVRLTKPLPGVRSEIFVFYNEVEAQEFESSLWARNPRVETESGQVGEPQEVFPEWSF